MNIYLLSAGIFNFQKIKSVFFKISLSILVFLCSNGYGQTTVPFTTTTNWTCPIGVTTIQVNAYGAGGGGGRGGATNKYGGGGGGGGAYSNATNVIVTPGNTYTITVGVGGAASTTTTIDGGNGTITTATFDFVTVSANAGAGGKAYTNGANGGAGGTGGTASGGTGGTGLTTGSGGGGGCAGGTSNGGNGTVTAGGTSGGTNAGAGANGTTGNATAGINGNNYGGGASGGTKNVNGGKGANGYLTITYTTPALSNDEPCSAIPLTVNTSCSYTTYTNAGATASAGIPAPGCASYSGGDVWFSAVVPATGILTVDTQTGVITDGGIAFYTGACGSLSLLACDDDSSVNGLMPYISLTGLTPGQTIFIRVWEYGNDNNGTFGICATAPSCVAPTLNSASSVTTTSATISWIAPTPAPSNGYQYVVSTSSTSPSGSGTATAGTSVNLTGLIPNTTYYVFVRSDCGGSFSVWTPYVSFTTGYCPSTSTSSTYYISNFSTTGGTTNITNNSSGYSAGGYGNYTGMVVTQQNNGTINFSTSFYDGTYTYGFNIWVDWNDDMDFNDPGEKVYSSGAYVTGATGSFVVPNTASAGNHRMRIVANYFSTDPLSCGSISSGETEDYTVNVTTSLCPGIPTAVVISNLTQTTATGSWTASSPAPANGYQYYLSTSATPPNSSTTPTGSTAAGITTVNLSGLTPDTVYYVYIRNNCDGTNFSPWTTYVSFITGYCASNSTSSTYFIKNFSTTGGYSNITNNNSGYSAGGYGNFSAQSVSQINSGSVSFSAAFYDGFYSYGFNIWVDWNDDLDFNDSGELVYASGAYVTSATGTITVPATASIGNHRMRIVANYFSTNPSSCGTISYGETEDYTFTVMNPLPCSANPSGINVTLTSQTTATVTWTAASPVPTNGYQYYLSTSNSTPSAAASPTGTTTSAVTTVNLTSLSSGTTYYVWVRSDCGGALGQGVWIGPFAFTQPNCSVGTGIGTSAAGCPTVLAGGLGLNGVDPAPISSCSTSNCVDLEATYLQLGQTTNYTVQSIPYNPPYQYNCLQHPLSVNVDDVWSTPVNLPFNFCYYGNTYSQCLIGSNGVITFDQTSNTPGGYSTWSFSNNIPNNTLFLNTIFGVYQDIDPSIGGEVGWELITLNTGCRALVASWSDIPMFSSTCNSMLYTGMIVLYENTNIIEVYIKEKNVCGSWNGGNAIVGLQNANGTQAVVAPNRNGLDSDWAVTNEAWRFIPSGPSITSITWHEGSGITGPVVGTTSTITVCPASTTTYTAEVVYTVCTGGTLKEIDETIVTVNGNKIWNGAVDTDWNKANNWTPPGVPNGSDCVVIPLTANNPIISGTGYNGLAGTLTVLNFAVLTVNPNNNITVTDWINVQAGGTFQLENTSNLVQLNNATNIGNIVYKRDAFIRKLDYVYWSSPVENFNVDNISSPIAPGPIYKWNPTVANPNGGQGNWENAAGNTMTTSKGYIVRGPYGFSTVSAATLNGVFTGVPNNGPKTIQISRGSDTNTAYHQGLNGTEINNYSDNWNLVGNPYPSSIRGSQFLFDNNSVIEGNIKLWTHGTLPSAIASPFYDSFTYNYSPGDYLTYNFTGTSCCPAAGSDLFIGAGQGFFVQMKDGPAATNNISFNNNLRDYTYDNSSFFRMNNNANNNLDVVNIERNRMWIDLINTNNMSDRTLVGYIQGATMGRDSFFDANTLDTGSMAIYSLIGNDKFGIQGRTLPFDVNDEVPIGIHIQTAGDYSIALAAIDGLFNTQNIYLRDKILNVTHDLKVSPYHFNTAAGTINNRFKIIYLNGTALNNTTNTYSNNIKVITNENVIVNSSLEPIKSIIVYDVLGQKIKEYQNINATTFTLANLQKNNTTLFLEINLNNGIKTNEKIIF